MLMILKYLKVLGLLKDAVATYKEEKGDGKVPVILHRRVMGAFLVAIATGAGIYLGVSDQSLIEAANQIATHIDVIGTGLIGIYGIIMMVVGVVKRKREN